jgi:ribosomal protein S18 acetylase RimI-like enzyme
LKAGSGFTIHSFESENQAIVQDLINSGLGDHWGHIDPSMNPDLFDISVAYQHDTFLVAWQYNEIIGTGALVRKSHSTGEIVRMTVRREYRRLGIGTRILNALVEIAKDCGYRKVILETSKNWHDVINFYLSYGFQITHYTQEDVYFELILGE